MTELKSNPSRPRDSTVKKLFAFSRNQCAFEGCDEPLADRDAVFGDICHIEGSKEGSKRWRRDQDPEERHGFDNLVLLCKGHHTRIDTDADTYTVAYLKAMKRTHEDEASPLQPDLVERAVQLFIGRLETEVMYAGAINVNAMSVATLNVFAHPPARETDEASSKAAMALLAPELGRIVARQIHVLDRATVNFLCASTGKPLPTDAWSSFRPTKPTLYPNAPAFRELAHPDSVLLAEFYDHLEGLDDHVVRWHDVNAAWDMNTWNVLMQAVAHSVEAGLRAVDRFCPDRPADPSAPATGKLSECGRASLETMKTVLEAHIARWTLRVDAFSAARASFREGARAGDYATELTKLAGANRLSWMEAVKTAYLCAAIPRSKEDPYYGHALHGLCLDEIALYWLALARQGKLRLDLMSHSSPIAVAL